MVWPLHWKLDAEAGGSFETRLQAVLRWIDSLPYDQKVYIVGNSAGGIVAALVALLRPDRIGRAIAVASPLNQGSRKENPVLDVALRRLQRRLANVFPDQRGNLAAFYGRSDSVVPPQYSQLPGVRGFELPTRGHPYTILMAHTAYGSRLAAWLKGE